MQGNSPWNLAFEHSITPNCPRSPNPRQKSQHGSKGDLLAGIAAVFRDKSRQDLLNWREKTYWRRVAKATRFTASLEWWLIRNNQLSRDNFPLLLSSRTRVQVLSDRQRETRCCFFCLLFSPLLSLHFLIPAEKTKREIKGRKTASFLLEGKQYQLSYVQ